jgi:putative DNA primase/helicase
LPEGVTNAPNWPAIPEDLANRQQWLVWKFEPPRKGSTKPVKMPYYVTGGRRQGVQGDDKDRMKLATLAVARRAYEKGGWNGVGFAFLPGDGLIGIDIDGAIDLATGEMSPMCANIIEACRSYTERSPSGKGVHIIVKGHTDSNKDNGIGLEVFCGRQYFTFTTDRLPGAPADVKEISEEAMDALHERINEAKAEAAALRQQVLQQQTPAPAPRPAPAAGGQDDDFRKVNDAAMGALHAWVPTLFPNAKVSGKGYRVTSDDLGRDLQEDLSIKPEGIVDFGVADLGDARQGKRTPIDLVIQWGGKAKPKDALHWLAQLLGVSIRKPGERAARPDAPAAAGGGGGDPPHDDDGPPQHGDDWGDGLHVHDVLIYNRGKPADCRENVLYAMRHDTNLKGLVAQNQFTQLHERTRETPWHRGSGEWDEEDDLMLGEYLARTYKVLIKSPSTLRAGVLMAAREHKFNPVVDLVRSQVWDHEPRLERWLAECLGMQQRPYTALIGALFVKGMVMRALQPGCKFDYMLILKGPQGARKSTVFRTLAQPWFTDNAIRMGDKDSLMALQSIWLAESSELESLNKAETNAYKQFLSASEDLFRPPYGAQMVKRPRHAVMGGTTNADTFLKDVTGDRRFWPLEVGEIDIDKLREWRLQLFAEALAMLESEKPELRRYHTTPDEERELVIPEQERFKMTDVWSDIISDYVNRTWAERGASASLPVNAKRKFFSTQELFERALGIKAERIDGNKVMETRLGNCMRELGFTRYRETTGARKRGYMREQLPELPASAPAGPPPPSSSVSPPPWATEEVPDDVPF